MKRIVICCDGTWNKPDNQKDKDSDQPTGAGSGGDKKKIIPLATNVVKLAEAVKPEATDDRPQLLYYDPGIGTSGCWLRKLRDGATGHGLRDNILKAYHYLATVYEAGDELYFFGFSRGAFTVRRVAGLVRNCGILRSDALDQIDRAYKLYTSTADSSYPTEREATLFRRTYAVEEVTPIHFIGVWDTVGTRGNPLVFNWATQCLFEGRNFHDSLLSSKVRYAYQALAIDERRLLFKATLWTKQPHAGNQTLEQRWFAGSHCNVGGSYDVTGLSDIALNWLVGKARDCGLDMEPIKTHPNPLEPYKNSRKWYYLIWFPRYRMIAAPGKNANPTFEMIDESVKEKYLGDATYRPKNLEDYFSRYPEEKPFPKA
jgi:uncharacterized protein (DUF2235 family)